MSYQIKSIRYRETPRKILLQNENGPCPLLAAANALLLRGLLSLPPRCQQSGVAGIDDVVHLLADHAVSRHSSESATPFSEAREYQLNEALGLLPELQRGMDVNPKFTRGPNGMEYTRNLAAFDALGVELVHGWLLDPQDGETWDAVGNRSYNELIELVILGKEAGERVERWKELLRRKEKCLEAWEAGGSENGKRSNDDSVGTETDAKVDDAEAVLSSSLTNENNDPVENPETDEKDDPTINTPLTEEQKSALQTEIATLRSDIFSQSKLQSHSRIIHDFLTATGHQLTYHGLEQLHNHLSEDALCVFFRNNHFATLTKHDGTLYLLVTDLGYAHAPEIVWEKLDVIDGDTEYADEFFCRPKRREELMRGPTAEGDYRLALALSEGKGEEEEGKLIAAATELSLRSYHDGENGVAASSVETDPVDVDREVALAWQREEERMDHESEQLARQLQELEYSRQRARPVAAASSSKKAASSSGCVVS
ncbi:hypothetical protein ACHAW6_014245 [Cyclotella cf. meneghiniana]